MPEQSPKASDAEPVQILKEPEGFGPPSPLHIPGLKGWGVQPFFNPHAEVPWLGGPSWQELPAPGGSSEQPPIWWNRQKPDLSPVENPFTPEAQQALREKRDAQQRAREEAARNSPFIGNF